MLTVSALTKTAREETVTGAGLLDAILKLNNKPLLDTLKRWNRFVIIVTENVADGQSGNYEQHKKLSYNPRIEGQVISRILNTKYVEILKALSKLPAKPKKWEFEAIVNSVVNGYLEKLERDGYIQRITNALSGETYADRRPEKDPAVYMENLNLTTRKELQEALRKIYKNEQIAELYDIYNVGRTVTEDPENPGMKIYSESLNPEKIIPDFLAFMVNKANKGNLRWLFDMANAQLIQLKGEPSVNNPSGMYEYKNNFYHAPLFKFFRAVGATPESWERHEAGTAANIKGKSLFPLVAKTIENLYAQVMGEEKKFGDIVNPADPDTMEFLDRVNLRGASNEFFVSMRDAQKDLRATTPGEGSVSSTSEADLASSQAEELKMTMDKLRVDQAPEATPETMILTDQPLILEIRRFFLENAVVPGLKSTMGSILSPKYLGDKIYNSFRETVMDRNTYMQRVFPHIKSAVEQAVLNLDQWIDKLDIRTSLIKPLVELFEEPIAAIPANIAGENLRGPLINPADAEAIARSLAQELVFQAGRSIQGMMQDQTRVLKHQLKKANPDLSPEQIKLMIGEVKQEFNSLLQNSR